MPLRGKVAKIHVKKGQTVKVGQPLLTIETEAETPATPRRQNPPPPWRHSETAKPLPGHNRRSD